MAGAKPNNFKRYMDLARIAIRTLKEPAHEVKKSLAAPGRMATQASLTRKDYFRYLLRKSGVSLDTARPPRR